MLLMKKAKALWSLVLRLLPIVGANPLMGCSDPGSVAGIETVGAAPPARYASHLREIAAEPERTAFCLGSRIFG